MTTGGRGVRVVIAALSLTALPHCAGLYNQARVDQAKEARTAFLDAGLAESLDEERKHTAAIHARELSVAEQHGVAIRDAELQQIIGKPPLQAHALLNERIAGRLDELGGSSARRIATKHDAIAAQETSVDMFVDAYRLVRGIDDPPARCAADAAEAEKFAASKVSTDAEPKWGTLLRTCARLASLRKELVELTPEGEYAEVFQAVTEIEARQKEVREQVDEAERAFKTAKDQLQKERNSGQPVDLKGAARAFKDRLDAIDVPEARLKWLETQQAHVSRLLAAAANASASGDVPPGVDDDLQIASALPGLAAQLSAGLRYPRVSALLLQYEHLRLEAERLRTEVARTARRLALLRAKLALMDAETRTLNGARIRLAQCSKADLEKKGTFARLPDSCRNAFTAALVGYANSWTLGRIPETKLDWAEVQLHHEASLDQSQSALAQWQNLIGVPLAALVSSYETGVKAEDIGRALNAAGLGWIGLGVH